MLPCSFGSTGDQGQALWKVYFSRMGLLGSLRTASL
ncbi:hypothetical protein NECAME_15563 [Necator americanus]|uniref:Uncharacterized protein n=1 Tax=Necator americanus TaxID=51031 RepID=W2SGX1_NECAM|nr:hypothetical protein NECAME_15563 [Necator americanus]ETN68889.1 hypothetical protein NECAME_15563 [Necator americanus]